MPLSFFFTAEPGEAKSELKGPLVSGWGTLQQAAFSPVAQVLKGRFP